MPSRCPTPRSAGDVLSSVAGGAGSRTEPRVGVKNRRPDRALRGSRRARSRRHGESLASARPEARAGSGDQTGRRAFLGQPRAPAAFRAGGAGGFRPQPPEHHHDLRRRRARRVPVHRDGADRGTEPPGLRRRTAAVDAASRRGRLPGRRRARRRSRAGDRAPRPEARERHGDPPRVREDPRLRPRQADAVPGQLRRDDGRVPARHTGRDGRRHDRLHVSGAGAGVDGRSSLRPVLVRHDAVRDALQASGRSPAARTSTP